MAAPGKTRDAPPSQLTILNTAILKDALHWRGSADCRGAPLERMKGGETNVTAYLEHFDSDWRNPAGGISSVGAG